MRILVVGATSTIAIECERIWSDSPGAHLLLAGRDLKVLRSLAQDLEIRFPKASFEILTCDFTDANSIQEAIDSVDVVDLALIAHGELTDQVSAQSDLTVVEKSLDVNAVSPVLFAEAIVRKFEHQNSGTLIILGSVAGDRGRRSNYVYGAAKGLLETYVQGLQHRFANSGIAIILVKPGPTATKMTLTMAKPPKGMADPSDVARAITKVASKNKSRIVYIPGKWRLIMFIIRNLPRTIFNRMDI